MYVKKKLNKTFKSTRIIKIIVSRVLFTEEKMADRRTMEKVKSLLFRRRYMFGKHERLFCSGGQSFYFTERSLTFLFQGNKEHLFVKKIKF